MANEYITINGKLLMVDGKLVKSPSETESSNALDEQSISLATTREVTNDIYESLVGYVNGSPKGAYPDINALTLALPSGATGIYLTIDDGKWNYWNGSSWVKGGQYLTNPGTITLPNGTVISGNADYAEIGKWHSSVNVALDHIGKFVTIATDTGEPTIKIATAKDDIRGVIVKNPAFCAGYSDDKYYNGQLKPIYAYVGYAGLVKVVDDGTCVVGERCMANNDGVATPSSNNMGYHVVQRVDATHVMIIIEPSADMIQRIKSDIENLYSEIRATDEWIEEVETSLVNDMYEFYRGCLYSRNDNVAKIFKVNISNFQGTTDTNKPSYPLLHSGTFLSLNDNGEIAPATIGDARSVYGVKVNNTALLCGVNDDVIDENLQLEKSLKYIAVVTEGIVTVIDNGSCTVGSYCTVGIDRTAVPYVHTNANQDNWSPYGFKVLKRVDDTHVEILLDKTEIQRGRLYDDVDYRLKSFGMQVDSLDDRVNANEDASAFNAKHIADLNEMLKGYVYDSTEVVGDTIPSTVEVSSTTYNVLDGAKGVVSKVEGDTVRCVNLIKLNDVPSTTTNGITYSVKDGVITLNGTCSAYTTVFLLQNKKVPNGQYNLAYFSSGSVQANDRSYIQVAFQTNNIYNDYIDLPQPRLINLAQDETNLYIALTIRMNQVFNNVKIKPMLVKGSVAPTEFQPYFEGLKATEYSGVKVSGPNLLNIPNTPPTTNNGVTYSIQDGVVTLNGTYTGSAVLTLLISPLRFGAGYFSLNTFNDKVNDKVGVLVREGTQWGIFATLGGINQSQSLNFTNLTLFEIRILNGGSFNNFSFKPMLVKGSVAPTTFVPYHEPKTLLPYPTTLNGVEGSRDTLEIRQNASGLYDVYKVIKTASTVLTSSVSFTFGSHNGFNTVVFFNGEVKEFLPSVSDKFATKADSVWGSNNTNKLTVILKTDNNYRFDINIGTMTESEFRSWFENNPITVTYQLATPTEEVIVQNLTIDEISAKYNIGGSVEVVNSNSIYGNSPKTTSTIVYKKFGV